MGSKQYSKRLKNKPTFVQSDLGKEFINHKFEAFLHENNIKLFCVHSDKKACIVERWNRTIMMRLAKWFEYTKRKIWINVIDNIVDGYNETKHQTIGCAPNQVNKYNEFDVWLQTNKDLIKSKKHAPRKLFSVGDMVRVKKRCI